MSEYSAVAIYFGLVLIITAATVAISAMRPSKKDNPKKFLPYESGIITETNLQQERFQLRHYLVGIIFLVLDVEVIFLYPWAVVAKQIGPFAFYEMLFFMAALLVGFIYIWRKKGLQWD